MSGKRYQFLEECNAIASAKRDPALGWPVPITLVSFSVLRCREIGAKWNYREVFGFPPAFPSSFLAKQNASTFFLGTEQEVSLALTFSAEWSRARGGCGLVTPREGLIKASQGKRGRSLCSPCPIQKQKRWWKGNKTTAVKQSRSFPQGLANIP